MVLSGRTFATLECNHSSHNFYLLSQEFWDTKSKHGLAKSATQNVNVHTFVKECGLRLFDYEQVKVILEGTKTRF